MDTRQGIWTAAGGWAFGGTPLDGPQLIVVFGGREPLQDDAWRAQLVAAYPDAEIVGCSTAGEIQANSVTEDAVTATLVRFEHTRCRVHTAEVVDGSDSESIGRDLVGGLPKDGLAHVFVLSDGQHVNGSALVRGMAAGLPAGVAVTGGLAGDGSRFLRTVVVANAPARERVVVAVGLYGDRIRVSYGSMGGWDPFGPERLVTSVDGNVLAELDGQSALDLYTKYLGDHAEGLPATGLLFPLAIRTKDGHELVRTILAVDRERKTMTFAGDIPQGSHARLMKANFDRLVDGAHGAAGKSHAGLDRSPDLAILISCVGRRLVLKQRTEDEVEAVREVLGTGTTIAGFYSYGEICPSAPDASCELHNQTMTITTLSEN